MHRIHLILHAALKHGRLRALERDLRFGVNFSTNKWNNQQRREEQENTERQCNRLVEEQISII